MTHEHSMVALDTATETGLPANGIINATVVPPARRMKFLPLHFGVKLMLRLETGVYCWMSRLCSAYSGGLWDFIELSKGGAYMKPTGAAHFDLAVEGNGFEGAVSPDAAGIIVTTFALNDLTWKGQDAAGEKYDQLFDYICQHSEREVILRAID